METTDILLEGIFEFRRHLLAQVAACDVAIERLTTLKESPVDTKINPNDCAHYFVKGACGKCGIYKHVDEKSAILKEADKLDK